MLLGSLVMGAGMIQARQAEMGTFYRFTTGGNVAVYEGECIGRCPKEASLYKFFPAFARLGMKGKAAVDVCHREDRYIMRTRDSRIMAVMGSRIYEQIKRPDWAND